MDIDREKVLQSQTNGLCSENLDLNEKLNKIKIESFERGYHFGYSDGSHGYDTDVSAAYDFEYGENK